MLSKESVISSQFQTKEWRKQQTWYKGGKHNECEIYQRELLTNIVKSKINYNTCLRINIDSYELCKLKNPHTTNTGFEWTEDFDCYFEHERKYYINLKFVCDKGGAQTRTLKEVYNFINCQLQHILKYRSDDKYFINILDGNTCFNNIDKFTYLLNKEKYKDIRKYVFIGDTYKFQKYWSNIHQNCQECSE